MKPSQELPPLKRPGIGNWFSTFAASGLILLCGLGTGALTARLLLPAGRGALATVLYWPQLLAGLGCLSLNEAVVYRVGTNPARSAPIVATAFWLGLLLAALTILVGWPLLTLGLAGEEPALLRLAQCYLVLFLPFNFVTMSLIAGDQGLLLFRRFNLTRLLQPFLFLAGLVFLLFTHRATVTTVLWASLLSTILLGGFRVILARSLIMGSPSWARARALLGAGIRFHGINVASYLASQMDKLFVIQVTDHQTTGLYFVALTVATTGFSLIAQTFHVLAFPLMTQATSREKIRFELSRGLRFVGLITAGLALPLIVILPWAVPLIFGSEFDSAVLPAALLVLAYSPLTLRRAAGYALRGTGAARPQILAEVTAVAVFAGLSYPCFRAWGLPGLALALGASNVLALLPMAYSLHVAQGLAWREMWGFDKRTFRELAAYLGRAFADKLRPTEERA